uniref:Uncharacterized protein n=1 Tax=Meloidogyne incognita TaxID=6306 RepID=A0A914L4N6_MELIC
MKLILLVFIQMCLISVVFTDPQKCGDGYDDCPDGYTCGYDECVEVVPTTTTTTEKTTPKKKRCCTGARSVNCNRCPTGFLCYKERCCTGARSVNCNRCPTGFLCYRGEYCYPRPTTTKKPTTPTTVKTTPKKSKQP